MTMGSCILKRTLVKAKSRLNEAQGAAAWSSLPETSALPRMKLSPCLPNPVPSKEKGGLDKLHTSFSQKKWFSLASKVPIKHSSHSGPPPVLPGRRSGSRGRGLWGWDHQPTPQGALRMFERLRRSNSKPICACVKGSLRASLQRRRRKKKRRKKGAGHSRHFPKFHTRTHNTFCPKPGF